MKKFLTVMMAAVMVVSLLAVTVGAQSQAMNGSGWDPDDVVTVKKADPADVVKDGLIGDGEYEKLDVNISENDSPLHVVFITGEDMENGIAMLGTMEYYFSWDEVHGFNFAVRNKPAVIQQLLDVKDAEKTEDDFLHNVGYGINAKTDNENSPSLYFALAKRTDDGRYLEGQYQQLGAQGNYNPGEDEYVINYDYGTGYVTIEWSVPLNAFFMNGGGAGSTVEATIWATAGETTVPDDFSSFYGVSLGDFGYAVNLKSMINHVHYLLSETAIEKTGSSPDDPGDSTGGGSGDNPGSGVGENPGTGANENPGTGANENPGNGGQPAPADNGGNGGNGGSGGSGKTAPKTGDPMIVMAAVAAVSAAGAFIVGKKRH